MRENHCFFRVYACRKIIHDYIEHVIFNVLCRIPVSDHLVISNNNIGVHTEVLHFHVLKDSPEIMPQMQTPGRPVSGKHSKLPGIFMQLLKRFI